MANDVAYLSMCRFAILYRLHCVPSRPNFGNKIFADDLRCDYWGGDDVHESPMSVNSSMTDIFINSDTDVCIQGELHVKMKAKIGRPGSAKDSGRALEARRDQQS